MGTCGCVSFAERDFETGIVVVVVVRIVVVFVWRWGGGDVGFRQKGGVGDEELEGEGKGEVGDLFR